MKQSKTAAKKHKTETSAAQSRQSTDMRIVDPLELLCDNRTADIMSKMEGFRVLRTSTLESDFHSLPFS